MKSPFINSAMSDATAEHESENIYNEIRFRSPFLDGPSMEDASAGEYDSEADVDLREFEGFNQAEWEDETDEYHDHERFNSNEDLTFDAGDGEDESTVDQREWEEDWLDESRTESEWEDEEFESESDVHYQQPETPVEREVSTDDYTRWFNAVSASKSRFADEPQHNIDQLPIPAWVSADSFYKDFIQKHGGEARTIIGDATRQVHARYFVLHDTAVAADFTASRIKGKGIHMWANAQSPVLMGNDWHVKGLGVKLERKKNHSFVHVEITRDKKLQAAVQKKTKGKKVSEAEIAKQGGVRAFGTYYTDKQYELVAYAYLVASIRRGKFLTVTIHREVDRSVVLKRKDGAYGYGHDDPQYFDIDYFYSVICRILSIPVAATFGIQNDRVMAHKQSNMPGNLNVFIPFVTGEVTAANQYGALQAMNPKTSKYKVVKLKYGYYYEVSQLKNKFQESEINEEYEFETPELFSSETGTTAATAAPLVAEDFSVPGYTCYLRIAISKRDYPLSTGVYIPASFDPKQPVDVVLFLHGMTGTFPGTYSQIMDFWSVTDLPKYDLRIREEINASGKNLVLVAPPLGFNPNILPNFLANKGGLDTYMDTVLASVNAYVVKRRFKSDAISFRNLILAAHSAGGQHMLKIAMADNPTYNPKLLECWGFDCIYYPVAKTWANWAAKHPGKKLFIHYQGSTEGNSTMLRNLSSKLSNVFVKTSPAKNHYWVVKQHLKDRAMKLGDSSLTKTNFETANEYEYFSDEMEDAGKDWSKAINLNRRYQEQLGWKDYYDQINDLLLPFSGQQNVSLGEEPFARALAAWQQQQGFSPKNADGILGPNTWSRMKPLLKTTPSPYAPTNGTGAVEQAEWQANPNIHSYYPTWQDYREKRNNVVSWGVPSPAAYIEAAIGEWRANPSMHAHFDKNFDDNSKEGVKRSYMNLRRLYQKKGIADPAGYFTQNIVTVTFFNQKTPAHRDLAAVLNTAQANLTAAGQTFNFKDAWSFVPRTFNADFNTLSNHALGKAIDINHRSNPHITNAEEFRVIDAVCAQVLTAGILATTDPDQLRRASDHYKATFNDAWVNQQTDAGLVKLITKHRDHLDQYAVTGFMNLPTALIQGLQSAGCSWGGAWRKSKDFMHFEI